MNFSDKIIIDKPQNIDDAVIDRLAKEIEQDFTVAPKPAPEP